MKFGIFEILYPFVWRLLPYSIRYKITQVIERFRLRSSLEVPHSNVAVFCFTKESFEALGNYMPAFCSDKKPLDITYDLLISCKNERDTISEFLETVATQKYKPKNLLICDAGNDHVLDDIVRAWSIQNTDIALMHFKLPNAKIATARNELARRARSEVLLYADLGTRLASEWVSRMLYPFENPHIDVTMGWYEIEGRFEWQKALKRYISKPLTDLNVSQFLPSTRSFGIRKKAFEKTRGFNEDLSFAGEDSLFGFEIKKRGLGLAFSPDARVIWKLPDSTFLMWKKIMKYAQGDAETGFMFWGHYISQLTLIVRILFDIVIIAGCGLVFHICVDAVDFGFIAFLASVFTLLRFVGYLRTYGPISTVSSGTALLVLVTAQMIGFFRGLYCLIRDKKLRNIFNAYE